MVVVLLVKLNLDLHVLDMERVAALKIVMETGKDFSLVMKGHLLALAV